VTHHLQVELLQDSIFELRFYPQCTHRRPPKTKQKREQASQPYFQPGVQISPNVVGQPILDLDIFFVSQPIPAVVGQPIPILDKLEANGTFTHPHQEVEWER